MITLFFYWDIRAGQDQQEYLNFIFNEYRPTMAGLGLEINDAWLKVTGEGTQIMALCESDDLATARLALRSREFRSLEKRLLAYVENYSRRIARRDIKSKGL